MSRRPAALARRGAIGCAAWAAGVLCASPALAANIEIQVRGCRLPVELRVRDAPLAEVLARLSKALGFQLRGEGPVESVVNLEMAAPAAELVAVLAGLHGSFMIGHGQDRRCPGTTRVSTLWLTSKATSASGRAADAQARRAAVTPVTPVTETATAERLRLVEADARRRKEAHDAHVRQYGMPPPGEPEEAARP